MAVDIEKVRKSLEVCPIKWVGDGKFTNEILDERHVRVVVPVEGLHLNHVHRNGACRRRNIYVHVRS